MTLSRSTRTLDDRICLAGPLSPPDVLRLGLELLTALAAAHDRGVRHGAIAPEHVLLAERDGVRDGVLDGITLAGFGVEAPMVDDHSTLGFSRLAFVAPERLDAATTAASAPTVASDLFALAATLHFAATGFSPENAHRSPGAFAVLPARISRVLRRAMHPEPRHRYSSAREMMAMLQTLRDLPPTELHDEPMPPTRRARASDAHALREEHTVTTTSTQAMQATQGTQATQSGRLHARAPDVRAPGVCAKAC